MRRVTLPRWRRFDCSYEVPYVWGREANRLHDRAFLSSLHLRHAYGVMAGGSSALGKGPKQRTALQSFRLTHTAAPLRRHSITSSARWRLLLPMFSGFGNFAPGDRRMNGS